MTAELHIRRSLTRDCVRHYAKSDRVGWRLNVRALAQEGSCSQFHLPLTRAAVRPVDVAYNERYQALQPAAPHLHPSQACMATDLPPSHVVSGQDPADAFGFSERRRTQRLLRRQQ